MLFYDVSLSAFEKCQNTRIFASISLFSSLKSDSIPLENIVKLTNWVYFARFWLNRIMNWIPLEYSAGLSVWFLLSSRVSFLWNLFDHFLMLSLVTSFSWSFIVNFVDLCSAQFQINNKMTFACKFVEKAHRTMYNLRHIQFRKHLMAIALCNLTALSENTCVAQSD